MGMIFLSPDLRAIFRVGDRVLVPQQGVGVDQGGFCHIMHYAKDPYTRLLIEKRRDVMRKYRKALEGEVSHCAPAR